MSASSLLWGFLLILVLVFSSQQGSVQKVVADDDPGSQLRKLWRLHLRETRLKGPVPGPGPGSPPKDGLKVLLYCRVGMGFHLQLLPGGSVGGVHLPTQYCWLQVSSIQPGVVGIRGVRSGLYLCLARDGRAYADDNFNDDCLLRENLEENLYTTYSSYPGVYLALSHKGTVRRGDSVSRHQACTHFLPRRTA